MLGGKTITFIQQLMHHIIDYGERNLILTLKTYLYIFLIIVQTTPYANADHICNIVLYK